MFWHLGHMKLVADDCMDAVLNDTQPSGNVTFRYSSVMHLGNCQLCGDADWPLGWGRLSDYPCHVWIQQPTSSPYCMKGHSPLVWPPCLHGSPWVLSPSYWCSGWPHDDWCCPCYPPPHTHTHTHTDAQCLIISKRKLTKVINFKHFV